jgi:hypothetical protein
MKKQILFSCGDQYPEIQAITSKKFYHGVLTVNLGIFDTGVLVTFATEEDGSIFSEVLGTSTGDLTSKGFIDGELNLSSDDEFEHVISYNCAFVEVDPNEIIANIDIMKKHIEEYDGLSHTFEDGTEIHTFLTKGESPEFTLYVMQISPISGMTILGESSVELTYKFI